MSTIKVLVVDDSAFMRKMLTEIIERDESLTVIGAARDGADALDKVAKLQPDVVTLDVEMPVMNGYATLIELMKQGPLPVLMVSSATLAGGDITLRCLSAGAVDFIAKPSGSISLDIERIAAELVGKIKIAAISRIHSDPHAEQHRSPASHLDRAQALPAEPTARRNSDHTSIPSLSSRAASAYGLLVIGASTGGPRALHALITGLGKGLHIPGIIVQHMPAGFTVSLAKRLDAAGGPRVREAVHGEALRPGTILVAPGGQHLTIASDMTVRLTDEPAVHGVRPAVDVTLESVARTFGSRTIAVLLTGMGRDGARGMKLLRGLGAHTFAEDESTCVVFGMPKAALDLDGVETMLPLDALAGAILAAAARSADAAA